MTSYTEKKDHLLRIIDGAIAGVSPEPAMHGALSVINNTLTVRDRQYDLASFDRILVIGAGKAAASMAHSLEDILDDHLHGGVVVTKYGHGLELKKTAIFESGHPVPDLAGERASRELISIARGTTERDLVFFLLSGGASALVPAPRPPVTLAMKQATTRTLLECGATINEINAIRKHLSRFKGGHLAKALEPATVVTLIISDVVGDHLDVIGSGPTAPDESTYRTCLDIIDKYSLREAIPDEVLRLFERGIDAMEPDTRKAGDECFARVQNVIIAGNAMALDGAAAVAEELGYTPVIMDHPMEGEARDMARTLMNTASRFCAGDFAIKPPVCLLAGGETTVTIRGKGKGGRNQELALAAAIELSEMQHCRQGMAMACVGTDGSDGATDAAGALVLPDTVAASEQQSLSARQFLANNDAYTFFTNAGTILKTGPTRTNVMDVAIVLVDPA